MSHSKREFNLLPPEIAGEFLRRVEVAISHRSGDEIADIGREVESWAPPELPKISEMSLAEFAGLADIDDPELEAIVRETTARTPMELVELSLVNPLGFRKTAAMRCLSDGFERVYQLGDPEDIVGRHLCRCASMRLKTELAHPGVAYRLRESRKGDEALAAEHAERLASRPPVTEVLS